MRLSKLAWDKAINAIVQKYDERAFALLRRIAEAFPLPHDVPVMMQDDDYRWSFCVFREGVQPTFASYEDCIDVTLKLEESVEHDGTYDGITFRIDSVHAGGRIVGGFAPYNYSDEVWVDLTNAEAVEVRFRLVEGVDVASIVSGIVEWFACNPREVQS